MSDGMTDLDVLVEDGADFDGSFHAIDVETGDTLRIHGWLIDTIEPLAEVDAL
jgi:hypothetical protein